MSSTSGSALDFFIRSNSIQFVFFYYKYSCLILLHIYTYDVEWDNDKFTVYPKKKIERTDVKNEEKFKRRIKMAELLFFA